MKSCERYELLASLVLDGAAAEAEQAELRAHLETCPECRAYFEDIKRIHEACAPKETVVPEGFSARVMDRVRKTEQDRPEKNKKMIPFPHWRRWTALAACCAVVVLSVWAFRSAGGGWKEDVTMDNAPRVAADAGGETAGAAPAPQEPEAQLAEEDSDADGAAPAETPAALMEEDTGQAKSAARDGAGQCQPQVSSAQASPQEPDAAAAPPVSAVSGGTADALPGPEPAVVDCEEPKDDAGDNVEPEQQPEYGDIEPEESPTAPPPEEAELPEDLEETEAPEETVEPAVTEAPAENEEPAEPVEVIGVPEPGILIAYGPAAQSWVEDTLGLEWAIGGSYPLTAEQYGDLLETLDEAGEPYSIAEGEDYCLMTE